MAGLVTYWFSSPLMPEDVSYTSKSLNQELDLLANFSGARSLSRILLSPVPRCSVTTVHP